MPCRHCHNNHPADSIQRPAVGIERRLIDDLLQAMDRPSAVISDIAVGSHFIGVRADENGSACTGLASALGAAPTANERMMMDKMIGKPLHSAAEWLKQPGAFSISLGAAALNAGIIPPQNQPDIEASRIMAEKGKDDETVLVGEFPFTDWLRQQVKTLYLFELQKVAGRTPPDQWDDILGRCKVLGLTGTTLITRAMASYLKKAPHAHTIIIGPTTPLSPVLFSHGADVLAGCQVVRPEAVFTGIREGMSFRELKKLGIRFIAWSKDSVAS
ncbi:Rossmann-like domain-containing protein [uncultured Desulfosarcina sp.]|uniref:Rossmann-like domain-containing protein n=1 Tax=uncultured Desulfosarcina sp. TaxID=218289 RepID=UPI0029C84193|nr:DUF364 domain-containing protein [uncultured Desulfosarcina sp.]